MAEWYNRLFPDAESEDDLVLLYSFHTLLGDWELQTPVKTFKYRPTKEKSEFFLFWNDGDDSVASTNTVFEPIISVAQHQTGVSEWDESSFKASDYLKDWKREVSDRVIFNFIDYWMECRPAGTLREMVDYFEHEDTHLIDRMNIAEFLKEMILTGQMTQFPRVWMPPAEMSSVIRMAKEYGVPVRDDRNKRTSQE